VLREKALKRGRTLQFALSLNRSRQRGPFSGLGDLRARRPLFQDGAFYVLGRTKEAPGCVQERSGRTQEGFGRAQESSGRAQEPSGRVQECLGCRQESSGRAQESSGRVQEASGRAQEWSGRARPDQVRARTWSSRARSFLSPVCSGSRSTDFCSKLFDEENNNLRLKMVRRLRVLRVKTFEPFHRKIAKTAK